MPLIQSLLSQCREDHLETLAILGRQILLFILHLDILTCHLMREWQQPRQLYQPEAWPI